ncbi:MAG: exodeoxyribonuclease III [Fimbriimonadaceae bacterium]|nr:exodeoxyribonuclease III [Fimbriimonadaceae bacterium]QYK55123.1 MAG: exodeoxyribonuclease III [Fimbriimonadaceae bacterium]
MRIATFNVNSIRARLPILTAWLEIERPDVVALQETKVSDDKFPLMDLEFLGYHSVFHGQPQRSGVAILSLTPALESVQGFEDPEWPDDARLLRARFGDFSVVCTYVPNGTRVGSEPYAYKLAWFDRFRRYIEQRFQPEERVVWLGDINVAPTDDDVYHPEKRRKDVGFQPEEKAALARAVEWGWTDCFRKHTQGPGHYTFWDYLIPRSLERNYGWRIDHIYATPPLAERCVECVVDKAPRAMDRPSDHTPLIATFDL